MCACKYVCEYGMYAYVYICVCVCIYFCVCVCKCMCVSICMFVLINSVFSNFFSSWSRHNFRKHVILGCLLLLLLLKLATYHHN